MKHTWEEVPRGVVLLSEVVCEMEGCKPLKKAKPSRGLARSSVRKLLPLSYSPKQVMLLPLPCVEGGGWVAGWEEGTGQVGSGFAFCTR